MAYDTATAERVRRLLSGRSDVIEKRMIGGGLGFMVGGHLCCGVNMKGLTVRVGSEEKGEALATPHVRPLEIGGRETSAFVVVEPDGYRSDEMLGTWVKRGLCFVATLP